MHSKAKLLFTKCKFDALIASPFQPTVDLCHREV